MLKFFIIPSLVFFTSCRTTYYIVRHAEKATTLTMTSDVPLSAQGEARAIALKDSLIKKKISHIFSTQYIRTKATAQPLSDAIHVPIETYDPKDMQFVARLKELKGNSLMVGHSNTVDELINGLTGQQLLHDLPDSAYGDLFIVTKKGKHYSFEKKHFGQ